MDVTLYESGTSRSARCRWTLLEAGITFNSVARPKLAKSDEVKALHPLGKLPIAVIDGRVLFESAAICTYIADNVPAVGRRVHRQHETGVAFQRAYGRAVGK